MVGGWKLRFAVQNLRWITALLHKLKLKKENPYICMYINVCVYLGFFWYQNSMSSELQKEYKILLLISIL